MDFGKELSSMSAVGRSLLSVGVGEGGGAGVEGAGVEAVGIPSATDDAGEGPLYELIVKVPSRNRLLADLSATLSQLDLDVLDGDCLTDEKGRANDRLRVRDLSAAGRAAAKAAAAAGGSLEGASAALAARVQQALCDALEATRLLQGDAVLLEEGVSLKSGDYNHEPLIGFVNLRALGLALALHPSPIGHAWCRFVACLAPGLLPFAAADEGQAALRAAVLAASTSAELGKEPTAESAAAARARVVLGGTPQQWLDALIAFGLHRLREQAKRGEDGLVLRQLQLGNVLGSGASGVVRLGRDKLSGRFYAVKSFSKERLATSAGKNMLRYLERERDLLRLMAGTERGDANVVCRWVIHLVTSGQDATHLHVVMPACLGGELWNVLAEFGAMDESELRFYAACLILALERLHALGVVYRDLKPENVLLRADGWPVLADLGLAGFVLDERPLFSVCGTPEFMAPEVIQNRGYGIAADWWSLGVLLVQCLTLTTPFQDPQQRPQKTFDNILTNKVTARPEHRYAVHGSKHTTALLDALLDRDAGRRLGSSGARGAELKPHAFFWGLDWEALQRQRMEPPHADFAIARGNAIESSFEIASEVEGVQIAAESSLADRVHGW
jgi:serine/threonine protein kinase